MDYHLATSTWSFTPVLNRPHSYLCRPGEMDPRRSSNGSSRRGHLGRCRCRAGPLAQPLLGVVADPFLNPLAGGHMLSPCPQGVHHRWRMRRKMRSRGRSNLRLGAWARWLHQHARYLDDVGVSSIQSQIKVGSIQSEFSFSPMTIRLQFNLLSLQLQLRFSSVASQYQFSSQKKIPIEQTPKRKKAEKSSMDPA